MNLKQTLLELLDSDQLKDLCNEIEIAADRRSRDAMASALAGSKRAKPELLIQRLSVSQLRELLRQLEQHTDGGREELVERALAAGGRASAKVSANVLTAQEAPAGYASINEPTRGRRSSRAAESTEQYLHRDEAVQRPDAGVQDQFQAKKPPRTYRYDSSLDPALSWDEQRERDLGEWLLGLIARAAQEGEKAVFTGTQEWKGGGNRISSIADAVRMLQEISKPFLNWAGKAERHEIRVPTAPLFVHERHSTKAILDGIRHRKARGQSMDLFGDSGMDIRENLEAYEHKGPWQNRMILGDSLSVMNSLLEFEGMAGQVQMIYIDPPYGVKFGSNFQPFVRNREMGDKHGKDEFMTREPEMVKAYRDTWELGLHSYLTYLRDRLMVAMELLDSSGSIFVQISDENLHHVRELLDEIFGETNLVSQISFRKTGGEGASQLGTICDFILWYARDKSRIKFRPIFTEKVPGGDGAVEYTNLEMEDGSIRPLSETEIANPALIPEGAKVFATWPIISPGPSRENSGSITVTHNGAEFQLRCPPNKHWSIGVAGTKKLWEMGRLLPREGLRIFKRYLSDFAFTPISNQWMDTRGAIRPSYVVQTSDIVIRRCMLMTTDPGDLVLDPTCGSGTTAFVAEQWGRRWITIDTSRVPLALTRQRLLTATFSYFELKSPQTGPSAGFVYKRKQLRGKEFGGLVPHVTLKSLANDEVPAMEVLVDRPEEVPGVTRVSGPFVVEATIAPVQPLETSGNVDSAGSGDVATHIERMTEVLRQSKTLRLPGNRELILSGVRRTVDAEYLHAEAKEGDKKVAIVFGPADGAVSATLVYEAGREAHYLKYERLYFFGFAIEPNARAMIEDVKKLRIHASYVAVTPDVAMSDLLKTTRASEIFSVTGLPDAKIRSAKKKGPEGQALFEVELRGLDLFDPDSMKTEGIKAEDLPCWMIDTDYDGLSFYATQVFFPKTSAWDNLQRSLKATFDDSVWEHLAGTVSEPFALGDKRRVAVKVIDERGNELMQVLEVAA